MAEDLAFMNEYIKGMSRVELDQLIEAMVDYFEGQANVD
jgi:hypothetical protein